MCEGESEKKQRRSKGRLRDHHGTTAEQQRGCEKYPAYKKAQMSPAMPLSQRYCMYRMYHHAFGSLDLALRQHSLLPIPAIVGQCMDTSRVCMLYVDTEYIALTIIITT